MKKIFCLIFSAIFIASLLVGCEGYDKNPVPKVNTRNTEKLKEKYIMPIVYSGIYGNWEDTEDIFPNYNFIEFYLCSGNLDYDEVEEYYTGKTYYFDRDKVENFVMKYFDVTPEMMRDTDYYKEDKKMYTAPTISFAEIPIKITAAKQEDDILTINFEMSDIKGEVLLVLGTKIKLIDKDNYKYIACSYRNLENEKARKARG